MDSKKLAVSSIFLSVGLLLHYVTPALVMGVKPDFLLVMMFLAILFMDNVKEAFVLSLFAGAIAAFTTSFPMGQLPNIIDKYHLVYNGVNTRRFSDVSDDNIPNKPFIVGYAGRIIENKGIFDLLDAVRVIHNKIDEVRLVICGDGKSADIEQMNQYIKQHQMEEYVQYMGFQKDMNRWYRSIHCLVAPSKVQEAFGLVLCEAMYCKVPVITSTSGAQAEIIENGKSGILIDTVNSESIIEAIQGLMENDGVRKSIIEHGYTRVKSTFTIDKMVDSIDKIVCNLR